MHAAMAGSKLVLYDGGHLSVFSKPDALCAEIDRFLGESGSPKT
jgi:hypothetical protein